MRVVFLLLLAILAVVSACRPAAAPVSVSDKPVSINDRRTTGAPQPQASKPLAEMSWTDQNERVHKIADFKGKALVLDFWATYCGPCRDGIPHLNSLQAKYGTEKLQIVGLNVGGEEDFKEIPNFLKTTKIDYPIAAPDDALTTFIFFERSDIPQTLILDRGGNVVTKIIGFSPAIQKDLDAAVAKAVATN